MSEIAIPTSVQQDLPAEGWHNSTIIEVFGFSQYEDKNGKMIREEDLENWKEEKSFKNKLKVVFEVEEKDENGLPIKVKSKPMNQTLGAKAALREFLDMIDRRILKENKVFTPELIVGRACRIKIEHYTSPTNGRTYPNIKMIDEITMDSNDDIPSFS